MFIIYANSITFLIGFLISPEVLPVVITSSCIISPLEPRKPWTLGPSTHYYNSSFIQSICQDFNFFLIICMYYILMYFPHHQVAPPYFSPIFTCFKFCLLFSIFLDRSAYIITFTRLVFISSSFFQSTCTVKWKPSVFRNQLYSDDVIMTNNCHPPIFIRWALG